MTMVSPFDHPDIIAGQGTLGLEMAGDLLIWPAQLSRYLAVDLSLG